MKFHVTKSVRHLFPSSLSNDGRTAMRLAVQVTMLGMTPGFLVSTLAIQIRDDLDLTASELGFVGVGFFGAAALLTRFLGTVIQKTDIRWGVLITGGGATASLLAASVATSSSMLLVAVTIGGIGLASAHPTANVLIADGIEARSMGLAFGLKQSAVPLVTMLSGLAVPLLAIPLGWRVALWIVAGFAVALAAQTWYETTGQENRRDNSPVIHSPVRTSLSSRMTILTIGASLAAAASTTLGVFIVSTAVDSGFSPRSAGLLAAGCSLVALWNRLWFGILADRAERCIAPVQRGLAMLMAAGAGGYVLLGFQIPWLFAFGAVIAYGAGWAWQGLFEYVVVLENRRNVATVTGFIQTGLSLGCALGPLLFGIILESSSQFFSWSVVGCVAILAALLTRIGSRTYRSGPAG